MKLTPQQENLLEDLYNADQRYRRAKDEEWARARREADERILAHLIERDKIAARARRAGIPVVQIAGGGKVNATGLSTSDSKTAKRAIEHGEQFLEDELVFEQPAVQDYSPFEWDGEGVQVTFDADTLARYGFDGDTATHTFTLGEKILPQNHDDDAVWQNPVVRVVMGPVPDWRDRIAAYAADGEELAA